MSKNNTPVIILIAIASIVMVSGGSYAFSQMNKSKPTPNTNNYNMSSMNHSMMGMDMVAMVKDDQTFIEQMIPHHQEAVDTSKIIIAKTNDPELKQFAQKVINDQNKEIGEMKEWYKTWFNKDYTGTSTAMMGDLSKLSGMDLDKAYVKGMIEHHQGAIDMANKIQPSTQRQEIKTLATNIVSSQTKEVATLKNWMMSKYNDRSMMGM